MTEQVDYSTFAIYVGIDVGKSSHHICALDKSGTKIVDKKINQDETELRQAFRELVKKNVKVLVVVDQVYNIGALTVAVAKDMNIDVAYLTGYKMRQFGNIHQMNTKTDAVDAFVIANAALKMPESLIEVKELSLECKRLKLLCGEDEDIVTTITASINRLRALLVEGCPILERALKGDTLTSETALTLLSKYGLPFAFKKAGKNRVLRYAKKSKLRGKGVIDKIFTACDKSGLKSDMDEYVADVIKRKAKELLRDIKSRKKLLVQIEQLALGIEDCRLLATIPGVGICSAAKIVLSIGDISNFESAAQLSSYAGCAPKMRFSGSSIHKIQSAKGGNSLLKTTLYQVAFCSISHNDKFRKVYLEKRKQGKRFKIALAHIKKRLCILIYSMLKNRVPYDSSKHTLGLVA